MSLLIVRSQRLSWIQVLNCQNSHLLGCSEQLNTKQIVFSQKSIYGQKLFSRRWWMCRKTCNFNVAPSAMQCIISYVNEVEKEEKKKKMHYSGWKDSLGEKKSFNVIQKFDLNLHQLRNTSPCIISTCMSAVNWQLRQLKWGKPWRGNQNKEKLGAAIKTGKTLQINI